MSKTFSQEEEGMDGPKDKLDSVLNLTVIVTLPK